MTLATFAPPPIAGIIGLALLLGWSARLTSRSAPPPVALLTALFALAASAGAGLLMADDARAPIFSSIAAPVAAALATAAAWFIHHLWLGYIPILIARRSARDGGDPHAHPRR